MILSADSQNYESIFHNFIKTGSSQKNLEGALELRNKIK